MFENTLFVRFRIVRRNLTLITRVGTIYTYNLFHIYE